MTFGPLDGDHGAHCIGERLRRRRPESGVDVVCDTRRTLNEVEAARHRPGRAGLLEPGDDGTIIAARGPTLPPTVHEPDVRPVVSG